MTQRTADEVGLAEGHQQSTDELSYSLERGSSLEHQDGVEVFLLVDSFFCSPSKGIGSSTGHLRRRKRRRKRLHQDSGEGREGRENNASPYYMCKEG